MREIKFRAWDKKLGGMFKGLPVSSAAAIVVADRSVDLLRNFRSEDEQWIVMQFTGLHDKSGREIYEGDVVCQKRLGDVEHKYAVEWSIEVGAFYAGAYLIGDLLHPHEGDVEVIGNIYENPELLK